MNIFGSEFMDSARTYTRAQYSNTCTSRQRAHARACAIL
jgi:hypothetical protein